MQVCNGLYHTKYSLNQHKTDEHLPILGNPENVEES
jgi:hypothetical protein